MLGELIIQLNEEDFCWVVSAISCVLFTNFCCVGLAPVVGVAVYIQRLRKRMLFPQLWFQNLFFIHQSYGGNFLGWKNLCGLITTLFTTETFSGNWLMHFITENVMTHVCICIYKKDMAPFPPLPLLILVLLLLKFLVLIDFFTTLADAIFLEATPECTKIAGFLKMIYFCSQLKCFLICQLAVL